MLSTWHLTTLKVPTMFSFIHLISTNDDCANVGLEAWSVLPLNPIVWCRNKWSKTFGYR